ncbi:flagellar brake protein [Inhella gelatinilytica]|uniref:PilZ domain-containing protein n=1 Tax=Inhella gelatinilytica TaxID=2795030 RepID=A0A931IXC7_9BURK|nr:PilZ domain-containing protein [Inhella gelatinilytica]MBH9552750.1 PilZ domain-containing protein [Inhella gelatinilytica]
MTLTAPALSLQHPREIAAWLQELVERETLVRLIAPSGPTLELLPVQVRPELHNWDLRLPGLTLSAPPWLLQGPVHAVAHQGGVQMDFELPAERSLVETGGLPALRVALPSELRRHQRRQTFRVQPASLHHPRLLMPRVGALPLRVRTFDLSAGGIALHWPDSCEKPAPGALLTGLELEMGLEHRIPVTLQVQHVRVEREHVRVGCTFVTLPPEGERQLALYLNQLQRRQRNLPR